MKGKPPPQGKPPSPHKGAADEVRGFEATARVIVNDWGKPYEQKQSELAELRREFFERI